MSEDRELKEIKRLAGITEVFMQGGTPEGDPLETIRRQIATADQALAGGDTARVKAIFREIQHLIMAAQAHKDSGTDEGDFETLDKSLGLQQGY